MKSMKDLKVKHNKNYPPLPFMLFMSFMVNISYSSLSNPEPLNGEPPNLFSLRTKTFSP